MYDLMVDIETLDTHPSAVVLSIGAVVFDRFDTPGRHGPTFYVELTGDIQSQIDHGRTISADTLIWWMCQSPEARNVFDHPDEDTPRRTINQAASNFSKFCVDHRVRYIWAKDPDFDVSILRSLFEMYGWGFPFKYHEARAVRTVLDMPFVPSKQTKPVAHNALADAIAQATDIQEALQCLKSVTQSSESPAAPEAAKTPAPSSSSAT